MTQQHPSELLEYGSPEHAFAVTEGRHPGVRDGLQWLTFSHLPERLQRFSEPFYTAACLIIATIGTDSPELTTALNFILSAKDSGVRAGIRHDTGRAGSVLRPQAVVDPPKLEPTPGGRACIIAGAHFPHDWLDRADGHRYHCPGVENVS